MPNMEVTNNQTRGVAIWDPRFKDELVTFAGAGTLLAGTILARDSVSLKMVPFVKGGVANENGIPKAMLLDELVAVGAGDVPCRPIISGVVRRGDLVIDADGDASNVDGAVTDQLRDYGIEAISTTQLAELDNQ